MKLIIIHGPPAAGKLTVSRELARRTGFKVFHNHVSIDCVKTVFEFGSMPFWRVLKTIREETFAEAARSDISLIHTFCYAKGLDDEQYHRMIECVEGNGGEVHSVLLYCDDETRRKRIVADERKQIGKLTDPDSIEMSREIFDLFSPLQGRETLKIDTTHVLPDEAAERIVERYKLTTIGDEDEVQN